jgi:hypothetical protein
VDDYTPTIRKIFILRAIYTNIVYGLSVPLMQVTEHYTTDLQLTAMVGIGTLLYGLKVGRDCLVAFYWLNRESEEQAAYLELSERGDL